MAHLSFRKTKIILHQHEFQLNIIQKLQETEVIKDFTFNLLTFLLENIRKLFPHQLTNSIYSSTTSKHFLGGSLFDKHPGVLSARWL